MSNRSQNGEPQRQTTVEEGTQFKGTLSSTCPVVVRGMLDGDIQAPSLMVAATGSVVGNVRAQSIHSEGVLAGHVDADDVSLSGSVRSDTVIRAKTLEVKLARAKGKLEVKFGECILEVGDDPTLAAAKEPPHKEAARSVATSAKADPDEADLGDEPANGVNGKRERLSVPPAS